MTLSSPPTSTACTSPVVGSTKTPVVTPDGVVVTAMSPLNWLWNAAPRGTRSPNGAPVAGWLASRITPPAATPTTAVAPGVLSRLTAYAGPVPSGDAAVNPLAPGARNTSNPPAGLPHAATSVPSAS